MRVSIVTVTFNSEKFIETALKSLISQTYQDFDYIVVDGASKDETLRRVRAYEKQFNGRLRVLSETDKGIYDAMNKGLNLATGEIIGFLNSDDEFASPDVIASIVETFQSDGCDIVYGDINYVNQLDTTKVIRRWRSGEKPKHGMKFGWHPPHPAFYARRDRLIEAGGFDLRYTISADYEQMLRLIERRCLKVTYLPRVFVNMRTGGVSNNSLKNVANANRECLEAWANNCLNASLFLIPCKLAMKLTQYIKP